MSGASASMGWPSIWLILFDSNAASSVIIARLMSSGTTASKRRKPSATKRAISSVVSLSSGLLMTVSAPVTGFKLT